MVYLIAEQILLFILSNSFDEQIRNLGGIVDNMGNVHTTAHSYKSYLKENGLVIRDWTEGTNKPKAQKCDVSDIPMHLRKQYL